MEVAGELGRGPLREGEDARTKMQKSNLRIGPFLVRGMRRGEKDIIMKLKNQRGAAAVEFAIVLPVLVLLVFGIIEFSLALYDKAVITNASREGARAGIVAQAPRVTDASIRTVVKNYCSNYLITFGIHTTVVDGDISITPAVRDTFGTDLTITVTYPYTFLVLPKLMTIGPINLSATTVMKME